MLMLMAHATADMQSTEVDMLFIQILSSFRLVSKSLTNGITKVRSGKFTDGIGVSLTRIATKVLEYGSGPKPEVPTP